jgi:long-chain acyl-CoA synthetase
MEARLSNERWLAAYGDRIPTAISPDAHVSVLEMFESAMRAFADKPAFRCFDQTLTYADTDRLSRQFAAYLQARLGVKKADRIAVMLPNIPAFPLALLGIIRAGAVQVNVNPLYTPRELEHQLNDAGVEVIVIFNGVSATLAEIIDRTAVKTVINVGLGDGTGASISSPHVDARLANVIAFSDALAEGADLAFKPVALCGNDLLFLQYTGGTTGVSKGAALSHRNLVANTEQFKAFMTDALRPGKEVVVTALPLYHIFALMVNFISCFSIGAENWLVPNPRDMDGFVEILRVARCTVFTGVNTLYKWASDASEDRGSGFHRLARGDRWRCRRSPHNICEMEGVDGKGHPRRVWPVGNLSDPHSQSGDGRRIHPDGRVAIPIDRYQAARRQRHGSTLRRAW